MSRIVNACLLHFINEKLRETLQAISSSNLPNEGAHMCARHEMFPLILNKSGSVSSSVLLAKMIVLLFCLLHTDITLVLLNF